MTEAINYIPNRVKNAAVGGHVCGPEDIDFGAKVIHLIKYDAQGNEVSFASQITEPNKIYVIHDDFTLTGNVTIPANCVLQFDGGSLSNGTIIGNNTTIVNLPQNSIFNSIVLSGTWAEQEAKLSWWEIGNDINSEWSSLFSCFTNVAIDKDGTLTTGYNISREIKELNIHGNNSTLTITGVGYLSETIDTTLTVNACKYCEISGINFNFNHGSLGRMPDPTNITARILNIGAGVKKLHIHHLAFYDYGEKTSGIAPGNIVFINYECPVDNIVNIHDIDFNNIYSRGDGYYNGNTEVSTLNSGLGELHAIRITYDPNASVKELGTGEISRCKFHNFFNITDDGRIVIDDGSPIYLMAVHANVYYNCKIAIKDCYFKNVGKRGIKLQTNGCTIDNIELDWDEVNHGYYTFIECQGYNCYINNIFGKWPANIVVVEKGGAVIQNVNVGDCGFDGYHGAVSDNYNSVVYTTSNDTIIDNCKIETRSPFLCIGNTVYESEGKNVGIRITNSTIKCKNDIVCNDDSTIPVKYVNCVIHGNTLGKNVSVIDSTLYDCAGAYNRNTSIYMRNCKMLYSKTPGKCIFSPSGKAIIEDVTIDSYDGNDYSFNAYFNILDRLEMTNVVFGEHITSINETISFGANCTCLLNNVVFTTTKKILLSKTGLDVTLINVKGLTELAVGSNNPSDTTTVLTVKDCYIEGVPPASSLSKCYRAITSSSSFNILRGESQYRPTSWANKDRGAIFYDTLLNKPIIWGENNTWVDATGATV